MFKKQYVLFSETYPDGIVVNESDLDQYRDDDVVLYKIGKRIGSIDSVKERDQ